MASWMDWTAAAGPALVEGTRSLQNIAQLQESQRHNLALEQRASEQSALQSEQLKIHRSQADLAQQQFNIQKTKADRETAEYERGNTPVDVKYYLSKLGVSEAAGAKLLNWAEGEGLVEETAGKKIVRQRFIQPFIQKLQADPVRTYELETIGLKDIEGKLAELTSKLMSGKAKPEEIEAHKALEKQQAGQLRHLDALEYQLGIKKTKATGPFAVYPGGSVYDPEDKSVTQVPEKTSTTPEVLVAPAGSSIVNKSTGSLITTVPEKTSLTLAQIMALPTEDPRRAQLLAARTAEIQLKVQARISTMSPKNQIFTQWALFGKDSLSQSQREILAEMKDEDSKGIAQAAAGLSRDINFSGVLAGGDGKQIAEYAENYYKNVIQSLQKAAKPGEKPKGKKLTDDIALQFLAETGGDKDAARAKAKAAGYVWD